MTGRSKFWGKFQLVSNKQIELALTMNAFRREHNMSQSELAHFCNLYGEQNGVKFFQNEISAYERMARAPRKAKFQILCNVLNIEGE